MNNLSRLLAFLLIFFVLSLPCIAGSNSSEIVFKDVITDKPCGNTPGYICGADLYPDFSSSGLPPSFGIRRTPGLTIPAKAIIGAKIIKQQYGKWENWQIEIKFSPEYGRRMEKYTVNKRGKLMAMEIGGKLAAICPLASEKLGNELIITSTKARIGDLGNLLRAIYPQITNEIQTSPPNTPTHQDAVKPRP